MRRPWSGRLPHDLTASPLMALRAAAGLDLTETNPTRCGFTYPSIDAPVCGPQAPAYAPCPGGSRAARGALAEFMGRLGHVVDPAQLILCASTSEAYGLLFKLWCPPGSTVALMAPGYPLLAHLAEAEGLTPWLVTQTYEGGRWRLDLDALAAACAQGCRAMALVSPNNPTGAALDLETCAAIGALAHRHAVPVLVDQVFAYAPWEPTAGPPWPRLQAPLWVAIDGLSKLMGLPQAKVAWMTLHGAPEQVAAARAGLVWLSDLGLSLAGPSLAALPQLLAAAPALAAQIGARVRANRRALGGLLAAAPMVDLLAGDGGWSCVVRLPQEPDEEAVLGRLAAAGVWLQPGFLYDIPRRGHLVGSLLLPPARFAAGWARAVAAFCSLW